jgi:hypothetical protein
MAKKKLKELSDSLFISTNERTVNVVGTIDKNEEKPTGVLRDGKGYIDEEDNIWIYCGEGKPKNSNEYPFFWLEDEKMVFSDPPKLVRDIFVAKNLEDITTKVIIKKTEAGKKLFDDQEIEDMNAASSFFIPTIFDYDDFLKKIVKTVIIQKGIDINRLKVKTGEKYVLNNMISALKNRTKMSVIYFSHWMELLGCDFDITVKDNKEDVDTLKNDLLYQSHRDRISIIVDGEIKDLDIVKYQSSGEEESEEENNG